MPEPAPSDVDLLDALAPAVEAAVEALDDELMALYMAAAGGAEVSEAADRLAALADRVAAAADHWIELDRPAPEPEPDPAALLDEAGAALDAALDALDAVDPAHLPHAERARIADRARRAAESVDRAARTVDVFLAELPEPPAGFRTPDAGPLDPYPAVRDRIDTTALDPDRAFVAWSVTAAGFARACEARLADEKPVLALRVYIESAGLPPSITDHPVDTWLGQTTMEIDDRAGGLLVCAIGLSSGGTFAHIARATAVQLPRRDAPTAEAGGAVRFARVALGADGRPRIEAAPAPEGMGPAPLPEPGVPLSALFAPPMETDR